MEGTRRAYGYAKMEKEDGDERAHRRAQFLIYKSLERAESMSVSRRRPSFLRIRIRRLKVRIGRRLSGLRKTVLTTISAAKASVCSQFRTCKRAIGAGGDDRRKTGVSLPPVMYFP